MVPSRSLMVAFSVLAIAQGAYALLGQGAPLLILVGCVLFIGGSLLWYWWMPRTLVCVAIPLAQNQQVEVPFKVRLGERYELDLEFERRGHSEPELHRLLGTGISNQTWLKLKNGGYLEGEPFASHGLRDFNDENGVVVPVIWEVVNRNDEAIVTQGQLDSKASNSWSGSHIRRLLGRLYLRRGQYIFRAKIPHPIPELAAINARLRLYFEPTHGESWQNALSYLFGFLAGLVATPVALFSAAVALVR